VHHEDPNNPCSPAAGIGGRVCVNHLCPVVAGGGGMSDFWKDNSNYRYDPPVAEPVAYLCENAVGHKYFRWKKPSSTFKPIALYTTPPAAAVPDAIGQNEDERPAYAAGWNDCRQAMLEMMK
jgi:hypothetical protein